MISTENCFSMVFRHSNRLISVIIFNRERYHSHFLTYRWDDGKKRLWRSCKTPFRCNGQGSKNPAPLGADSSNR